MHSKRRRAESHGGGWKPAPIRALRKGQGGILDPGASKPSISGVRGANPKSEGVKVSTATPRPMLWKACVTHPKYAPTS